MAAMMNMTNLLNGKDSRWLQLEVCREFQRNKCSRPDTECKFAHPPANVEVQNGRVTACYDSIKGRCNREKPPCKYFHPPQHLKDQLLINGRNHLALKNAIMQQMGISPGQPVLPGQVPAVMCAVQNGATTAVPATAIGIPPATAAALGFTIAWGTAGAATHHHHPPPPYTTYVVSHGGHGTPGTGGGGGGAGQIMNGHCSPITAGSPTTSSCQSQSNQSCNSQNTCHTSTTTNTNHNNNNNNHISVNNNSPGSTCKTQATNPYLASMPASTYSPYFPPGHLMPTLLGPADPSQLGPVVQQAVVPQAQQKIPRSDRLEVCREFMRGACKRAESECRFAHPQESVTTHEDGSVTVCMDAVKGRCAREPCRYFHPPLHLQAQIKAAQSRATATAPVSVAAVAAAAAAAALPPPLPPSAAAAAAAASAAAHSPLEAGKKRSAENDMIQMAFPGMVPYKRTAADKSGIPVYQPGATTYQQLMQLQQPFVPVSCEYPTPSSSATSATYIPQTSSTATLIANSSNSAPSTILTSSSYYTSSGNSVNNNNNSNKVNNKNTTLAKSLSLQSVSSIGHLSNGQVHSDTDQSVKSEGHLSEKDDLSVVSAAASVSDALLTLTPTSTAASQAMVSTSATQSVPAPITSAMLNYSVSAAQINSYNASIQAQAQAVHAAQAAAVAQANQAAAASAQYSAHYADAANLAKEVAQKNYANALKMAAASNALTGKPLTALSYTGVALNKTSLMTQAQSYGVPSATAAGAAPTYPPPRIGTPAVAMAAATPQQTMLPTLSRPPPPIMPQAAFTQMLRPQMPANLMHNPYAAAAAVAQQQQQLMSQAGFMYPAFQAAAGGYQFGSPMHTAMPSTANLTGIPGAMTQVPQVAATPTPGSAVVLNPYKKMKTS
ncbi:putative GPI-anchored protein pfl2 isoform X3 [Culex quinquefasciatus]|uniref:putative GPI-anchored protein pfl2 isoform X3 n=1 Tax=Culex quinquefasciatus TaxID=7176 RepID=UPI0018E3F3C1|nr:putative GPI-anchored protein pfl2 isoform X3 [Culex quinquefasciatus]